MSISRTSRGGDQRRRSAAKLLTKDEARLIPVNFAKLPQFIAKEVIFLSRGVQMPG
jgi:hypothetical protein